MCQIATGQMRSGERIIFGLFHLLEVSRAGCSAFFDNSVGYLFYYFMHGYMIFKYFTDLMKFK